MHYDEPRERDYEEQRERELEKTQKPEPNRDSATV